ncbi:MAG: hypothetical protein WD010_05985, partial [Nitriliruptor sp.]
MSPRQVHRRRRTRGVLVLFVLLVVVVLAGTEALVRIKPVVDTSELVVEGLPPRSAAAAEPRTCLRGVDASGVEKIVGELRPHERISSGQVYACPQAFDGVSVTYAGEVVGDVPVPPPPAVS